MHLNKKLCNHSLEIKEIIPLVLNYVDFSSYLRKQIVFSMRLFLCGVIDALCSWALSALDYIPYTKHLPNENEHKFSYSFANSFALNLNLLACSYIFNNLI